MIRPTPTCGVLSEGGYDARRYTNHKLSLAAKVPSNIETKMRFRQSGINSFLSLYEKVTVPHEKQVMVMCIVGQFGLCGGIGDRLKGIPYAVALAHITGRQLVLHPSLLANGPFPTNLTSERHFHFVDGGCTRDNVDAVRMVTAATIFVTVNCEALDPSPYSLSETMQGALQILQQECSIPYLCGAAAVHFADVFQNDIDVARRLASAMSMLEYRNYTALHIRAGGSILKIDNVHTTNALQWEDGYASDVPQLWLDAFRETTFVGCRKHLAVVSDSDRLVSELRFTAEDGLMITTCCSQPLHRDRTSRQEFFLQEIVDLFFLAHSRTIIAGHGGFSTLGRYWLGREGPQMFIAKTKEEIQEGAEYIKRTSGCDK